MSHIHYIGGSFNAASEEYQEYLARLGAKRRARRSAEEHRVSTFDSAIDPERDSAREHGGQSEEEADGEHGGEAKGEQHWSAQA